MVDIVATWRKLRRFSTTRFSLCLSVFHFLSITQQSTRPTTDGPSCGKNTYNGKNTRNLLQCVFGTYFVYTSFSNACNSKHSCLFVWGVGTVIVCNGVITSKSERILKGIMSKVGVLSSFLQLYLLSFYLTCFLSSWAISNMQYSERSDTMQYKKKRLLVMPYFKMTMAIQ